MHHSITKALTEHNIKKVSSRVSSIIRGKEQLSYRRIEKLMEKTKKLFIEHLTKTYGHMLRPLFPLFLCT